MLTPDIIDYTVREFLQQLRAQESRCQDRQTAIGSRRQQLEDELQRLAAAVASGGHSKVLLDEIGKRELEIAEIENSSKEFDTRLIAHPGDIRGFISASLKDLLGLIKNDVVRLFIENGGSDLLG